MIKRKFVKDRRFAFRLRLICKNRACNEEMWFKGKLGQDVVQSCKMCGTRREVIMPIKI